MGRRAERIRIYSQYLTRNTFSPGVTPSGVRRHTHTTSRMMNQMSNAGPLSADACNDTIHARGRRARCVGIHG